jgi:hypothetical protein
MSDELEITYRGVIVRGELSATLTQEGWTCDDELYLAELNLRFDPSNAPLHSDRFDWALDSAAAWMQAVVAERDDSDFDPTVVY